MLLGMDEYERKQMRVQALVGGCLPITWNNSWYTTGAQELPAKRGDASVF